MKKCVFYSMMKIEGIPCAIQHTGYQDNGIWYYKNKNVWQAISPENGLMIAHGLTRKEAAENATTPEMLKHLAHFLASDAGQRARTRFIKAVEEAEA